MAKKKVDEATSIDEVNLLSVIDTIGASATLEVLRQQHGMCIKQELNQCHEKGRQAGIRYMSMWDRCFNIGFACIAAWGIVSIMAIASHWVQMDRLDFARSLNYCSQGNVLMCQKAVLEKGKSFDDEDRERLLKSAYLIGTGKPVPEPPK